MTDEIHPVNVASMFVVLGDGGEATPIAYGDRFYEDLHHKFGDFKGKRLISHYTFEQDWNSWETHPAGDEFVCLLSGQVDFILEQNETENVVSLNAPGDYVLVPRGIWHTAKVHHPVLSYSSHQARRLSIDLDEHQRSTCATVSRCTIPPMGRSSDQTR